MSALRTVVVLAILLLAACGRPPPTLGVLLPLSGEQASLGRQVLAGVERAWQQAAADRPELRLLVRDNQGDPGRTAHLFDELVAEGATVVVGPLSGEAVRAAAVLAAARGVACVVPGAGAWPVQEGGGWLFRFGWGDDEAARALAAFARYDLGLDRMAVVVDLERIHSVATAEAFIHEFQQRRGRIVGEYPYWGGRDPDQLLRLLDQVTARGVDGIFIPGLASHVRRMVVGADASRLSDVVLLGTDSWEDQTLDAGLVGRVAGAYHSTHFAADEEREDVADFVRAYGDATGAPPGAFAALGHDTGRAVLELMTDGPTPSVLRDRLSVLRRFDGLTGNVTLDLDGAPIRKSVVLVQRHDADARRFVSRVEP